jgi:hypothetical protein
MTFYKRYLNGELKQVYKEIALLGQDAFSQTNFNDIERVLVETFQRTAYNLDVIYKELKQINYVFREQPEYNFEKPLHKPLPDTDNLLRKIEKAAKPFGSLPLSIKYFYKIVGGVNFGWDYDTNEKLMWDLADPIQITSLDAIEEMVADEYWEEEMQDYKEDCGFAFLELSADSFHKDNISGGSAYAIEISRQPSIDSAFLNEPNNTTFIDYLRICFESCGFPGIEKKTMKDDFKIFYHGVKPKLKSI